MASFESVARYSRQMFLFGASGQAVLAGGNVAVVGAGGIGSTAILYLAGAGVGRVHVFDFDVVERSNLHRQIIHADARVGRSKASSAVESALALNPGINVSCTESRLTPSNVLESLRGFDVVVDCTDNMKTRFVLNDACFLLRTPLVSGSAIGFEGQCTVFLGGCEQLRTATRYAALEKLPCYRCLHPRPSQASLCQSCSGSGVFGPAPGIIGTMLAGEVIKCLLLHLDTSTGTDAGLDAGARVDAAPRGMELLVGKQAYFDGLTGQTVTFNLPPRRADCPLCSCHLEQRTILTMQDSEQHLASLASVTDVQPGAGASVGSDSTQWEGRELPSISAIAYKQDVLTPRVEHVLLDVRDSKMYSLANLEYVTGPRSETDGDGTSPVDARNMPLAQVKLHYGAGGRAVGLGKERSCPLGIRGRPVYVLCRRGNASREAAALLLDSGVVDVVNITGGLSAWRADVDPDFPDM